MKTNFARIFILILLVLSLAACSKAGGSASSADQARLTVSGSSGEKTYTAADLKALGSNQAAFKGVTYVGVPLSVLLKDAGFDSATLTAVKAVASDGFTANYDSSLFQKDDTLVAYATADGSLAAEDGAFRMVLPDQEGKLNVRQLVKIQAVP
jgi:hypothetical protein